MATQPADLDAVKADLVALREDLASLSKSMLNRGSRSAREARDAIEARVSDARDSFEGTVSERPYTTVLLAFGAGLVASALLRRS